MPRRTLFIAALLVAPWAHAADEPKLLSETREVAASIPPKLLGVLKAEIDKGGPHGAIGACSQMAPKMAAEASQKTGWSIRRVSLRNRNPKAVPDAWEEAALKEFDQRVAKGEDPAAMEKYGVVSEGGASMFRYMKALPTQPLCLNCHGPEQSIPAEVKAKLGELYPNDKATGFQVGQIRGALTVKRPL